MQSFNFGLFLIFMLLSIFTLIKAGEHHQEHIDHNDYHDYHAHPKYKFDYGVHDAHTGDSKNQWEIRDGDIVKGGYEIHEPDGTKRVVEYSSDKHTGFSAHVKRVGHAQHPHVYGYQHGHEEEHGHEHEHIEHHGATSYANVNLHHEPHHIIHHP
ncbi:adult-specific cuticular protein ACP-22-like [Condylostylus longicornis]|uniref:adult-specific cuticular protein ACP-22-like n=1 Tax=Condylostylus longicornis TaxID=2530218 RepID=UPI00244DC875|nr:adult-specific cuticular protein ACP-22-like [Condylostylus longicornis]